MVADGGPAVAGAVSFTTLVGIISSSPLTGEAGSEERQMIANTTYLPSPGGEGGKLYVHRFPFPSAAGVNARR